MPISQKYINKDIDFCVLDTSSNPGEELVEVGILNSGSVISGPYKVIQKFIKFLLTDLGSVLVEPSYGTDFVKRLLGGQIQNTAELNLRFYKEADLIRNYIAASNPNPTPDEKLLTVVLQNFNVSGDYATMRLQFTFEDQSTILAPIRISTI